MNELSPWATVARPLGYRSVELLRGHHLNVLSRLQSLDSFDSHSIDRVIEHLFVAQINQGADHLLDTVLFIAQNVPAAW